MALRADDSQATTLLNLGCKLNIGTTTRHVGCDSHLAAMTRLGNDLCLEGVLLSVQHIMLDAAQLEHTAQQLRNLDRCSTHQDGATLRNEALNLSDYGVILLALGLIYEVIAVVANDGLIRWDNHNIEFVDAPELRCLGLGGTGHTRELVVHTEVVLQGDGCEGLRCILHLNILLRLDSLVQAIRVATALHDTTCLLVDNLNLVVDKHILHLLLEHEVCLEQLVHRMHTLSLYCVVRDECILLLSTLLCRELRVVNLRNTSTDVGQYEEALLVKAL